MQPCTKLPSMFRSLCAALVAALLLVPASSGAQQGRLPGGVPTDPRVVAQLMARLQASGMTPGQIRARLQAAGYPSSLLDSFLEGSGEGAPTPSAEVFAAVESLGLVDSLALDSIRVGTARTVRDTIPVDRILQAFADSLRVGIDSIDIVADSLPRDIERRLDLWRAARYRADRLTRQHVDSGMTIFGMNLFREGSTQFDANAAGPVDANYQLGPGDQLVLILTGDVEDAYELPVTREGFVVIPTVGQVSVAGLTLAQLEDVLQSRLSRVYSGIGRSPGAATRFSVSVARIRSNQVYVVGDVEVPGSYRVSSAGTAMSALYAAGGPTVNGSLRRVEIRRGGRTIATLDVYDYLLRGSSADDPRLQSGDVVFVPSHGPRARIWGGVIRPATYELAPGEQLDDLIRAAGGFKATADRRRVQIERILPPTEREAAGSDRVVMDVTSAELATGSGPQIPMQAGDVVRVFEISDRVRNQVQVTGNVWAPGRVAFQRGMRLSDALRRAGGVKPDTYLGRVLVTRLRPDSTRVQLRATLADTTGRALDDLVLDDADEITVFSQTEFRPERYVVISGAVRDGGRIPYREGMTLRDAVLIAGGLEESAMLSEAEVARMPESRAGGAKAIAIQVAIDSSYLFERTADGRYVGPPGMPGRSGTVPEVVLRPYDNVLIYRQTDWSLPQSVTLTGEVVRPGRYTLRSKHERLSDLIARAGGVTPEAHADGIVFVREDRSLGRIGVDLRSVLRDPRHRDNLLLVDGDSIAVPVFTAVINVRGNVNAPAAVTYVPGRNIQYYIDAAGGTASDGDGKRAFVTQPNGKIEARRDRGILPDLMPEPRPGAVVFVPQRDEATIGSSFASLLSTGAQVIGSIVTVVVLLNQIRQ